MYFKLLFEYFREHKLQFSGLVMGRLILYFFEIVVLSYLASKFSHSVETQSPGVLRMLLYFILFFVFTSFLWFCIEGMNSVVVPKIQQFVRTKILDSVLSHDFSFESLKLGSTLNNLSRIPHLVYVQMISFSYYIMPFFFTFLFLFIYFFRYGWKIGVSFMCLMVCFFVIFGYWFKRNIEVSILRYKAELDLSERFDDILMNSEQILNNNQKQEAMEGINRENKRYNGCLQKELMAMNCWKQTFVGCIIIAMGLMIYLGYYLFKTGKLSFYLFTSMVTLVIFIINRVISLTYRIGDIPYIIGGIVVSDDSMDQKKKMPSIHGSRKDFITNKHVAIKNLRFRYPGKKTDILKDIRLDIPFPSNHLITGSSGSGKTTLCRCIMGYYEIHGEAILIDDVPIGQIDISYLRSQFTIMTQNGFLFDSMVWENISKDPRDIEEIERLPIYPMVRDLLNRPAGKLGSNLSGGEKQIVLLLRSYFRDSFFILLDEPTSNIDPTNKKIIFEIIKSLCKKKSVLCITHDEELHPYFENVYRMENGTLHKVPGSKPPSR